MFFELKKLWMAVFCVALAACSGSKEIPQGRRISVLDMPQKEVLFQRTGKLNVHLSAEKELTIWSQAGSNAAHLIPNISVAQDAKEQWSESFGEGAGKRNLLLAQPVISNGVVYVQDVEGKVSAFDLSDGHRLFSQKLKPLNKNDSSSALNGAGLALSGAKIYALTGFGAVFAIDGANGKILWRKDFNVPFRTSPTVYKDKLFVQTIDNQLFNLDARDGSEIWVYNISAEDTVLAGGSAPAYDATKDIVVAAFSNGEIQAFNASIGYPLWSNNLVNVGRFSAASPINAVKASPVIDSNIVYAIGNNNRLLAMDIENGDVLWQREIGGVNTPIVDTEVLFVVSNNFELMALNKKTGETLWQKPILENMKAKERRELYLSGPLLINSELLVTVSNGLVISFDAKTGTQKRIVDLGEEIPFGPVSANKNLVFITNDAELIVYR